MTQETIFPVMAPTGLAKPMGVARVVVTGIITALLYSALSTGSAGICPGGFDESGFIDADGASTSVRPLCLQVTFHPQTWVLVLLAAIVIGTLVALGPNTRVFWNRRIVTGTSIAIVAIGIAATLATFPLFYFFAVTEWRGGPAPHFWFDAVTSVSKLQSN